jgi:hypothetical protein
VLGMRPTPVHRQWVSSVCEETAAVVLVLDGREVLKWVLTREEGMWASGVQRQRLRPGDARCIVRVCVCVCVCVV